MCRCVSYRYLIPVWQKHPRVDVFHCLVGETGLEPSLGFQLWANLLLVIVTWHQRPTMNRCAAFLNRQPGLGPLLIPFFNVAVVTPQPP